MIVIKIGAAVAPMCGCKATPIIKNKNKYNNKAIGPYV